MPPNFVRQRIAQRRPRIEHTEKRVPKWNPFQMTEPRLTFVGGNRSFEELDYTSRRILSVASGGTSVFDPVLCEIVYRWFCPYGGLVLDPFAGGSVRGIVASKCGRRYIGMDLS